jgi:hypothetical protein
MWLNKTDRDDKRFRHMTAQTYRIAKDVNENILAMIIRVTLRRLSPL